MDNVRFQGGQFNTAFLDGADGFRVAARPSPEMAQVAAIAATLVQHERDQQAVVLGTRANEQGAAISPWKQAGRPGGLRGR
jgi:hypothetical protein